MSDSENWVTRAVGGGAFANDLAIARFGSEKLLGRSGFALTSPAFQHGGELDPSFTAIEEDAVAPPLEWTAPPPGAQEMADQATALRSKLEAAEVEVSRMREAAGKGAFEESEVEVRVAEVMATVVATRAAPKVEVGREMEAKAPAPMVALTVVAAVAAVRAAAATVRTPGQAVVVAEA